MMELVFFIDMIVFTVIGGYILTSVILFKYPHLLHRRKQLKFSCRHISHRGGAAESLENTIATFQRAVDMGTDLLEMDVQLTKDGQVVVSHDNDLKRCAGVNSSISELNYDEIPPLKRSLSVDFCNGIVCPASADRRIPLLRDVFVKFPSTPMNIDVKADKDELIEKVNKLIVEFNREDITIWGSFFDRVAERCYKVNPNVPMFFSAKSVVYLMILTYTGLLPFMKIKHSCLEVILPSVAFKNPLVRQSSFLMRHTLLLKMIDWFLVRKFLLDHLWKRGIPTYLWVINDKEDYQRAFELGAAGIMTDRPTLLREFLEENPHVGRVDQ
ncbi:lysophospholipase D GDPD1-like [Ornithodoros turicata]|uniref:lysophospholipase D GDPD1-like n=1 Tax=Ornithodoros turicata TaxID=34597 RepID=UPI00313941A3